MGYFIIAIITALVIGCAVFFLSSLFIRDIKVRKWLFVGVVTLSLVSTYTGRSDVEDIDCSNHASYEQGYASGSTARIMDDPTGCYSFTEKANQLIGRDVYTPNECFCQGYRDGQLDRKRY